MGNNVVYKEVAMKEFAKPIIGTVAASIDGWGGKQLWIQTNLLFNATLFTWFPNEDSLSFIRDFYSIVQTFLLMKLMRINWKSCVSLTLSRIRPRLG